MAEIHYSSSKFYDGVVRFNYYKNDYISALLINDYKAYLLSNNKNKLYDYVINEYINNIQFNNYIHNSRDIDYYISDTMFYLINKYEEFKNKHITSRWL